MKHITIRALKNLEEKFAEETKSYIPIKTSEFIEKLKPEGQILNIHIVSRTYHVVRLHFKTSEIFIENSYRRERAFRLSIYSLGILIPVSIDRIIHRGEKANSINHIEKRDIEEAINNTSIFKQLTQTPLTDNIKKNLIDIIFNREVDIKEQENEIRVDNIGHFIADLMRVYEVGNYIIIKGDKLRKGRKKKDKGFIFKKSNDVLKYIKDEFPHLCI